MKPKPALLLLLSSLLSLTVSGCLAIPKGVRTSEKVVAVRQAAGGNNAEEVIEKRSAWHYLLLLGPDGPRGDFEGSANYTYFLRRDNQRPERLRFLKTKEEGGYWNEIRPVLNTDFWVALQRRMRDTGLWVPGHSTYSLVIFDTQHLVREKVLNVRGETRGTWTFDTLN